MEIKGLGRERYPCRVGLPDIPSYIWILVPGMDDKYFFNTKQIVN